MKTLIRAALVVAFTLGSVGMTHATTGTNPQTCTEDMECWDCHTMGNHICGVPDTATTKPTLGASVQSIVYLDKSPTLAIVNRSTIPALFTFEGSDGWKTDPTEIVLAPDERSVVEVTGTGKDGAAIVATVTASDYEVPEGQMGTALSFDTKVFHESPPDWTFAFVVGGALIACGGLLVAFAWRRRRYPRPRIGRAA